MFGAEYIEYVFSFKRCGGISVKMWDISNGNLLLKTMILCIGYPGCCLQVVIKYVLILKQCNPGY